MDSVDHIPDLARVGEVAAGRDVKAKHFQGFL
jgi:hypothetical protein